MNTTTISGLVALVLILALWAALRSRERHARQGVEFLRQYRQLLRELLEHDMPDPLFKNIAVFSATVGSGYITRRLFTQLVEGKLAEPIKRELIHANRMEWEGFHSQTRVLYVRTFFAGLRADTYFAGTVRGTIFRRAIFYLNADPAEIAHAVDSMETRILLLGAERAAVKIAAHEPDPCVKELVSV